MKVRDGIVIQFEERDVDENGKIDVGKIAKEQGLGVIVGIGRGRTSSIKDSIAGMFSLEDEENMKNPINAKEIVIPASVTSISELAFQDYKYLQNIEFENESMLTIIGARAFSGCASLKNIVIPKSVKNIGVDAFRGCQKLEKLSTPKESTIVISDLSFEGCESLKTVNFHGKIGEYSLAQDVDPEHITNDFVEVTEFSRALYSKITNKWKIEISKLTIPDGVTCIGDSALDDCENLKEIKIPDGVTSIDEDAFGGCKSLTEIKIPDGVTSIGGMAFRGCESLTKIKIPDGVTSIGDDAFVGCKSLKEIEIPDGVTYIGSSAFCGCENLTEIKIPNGVTSIGMYVFCRCKNIKKIKIPDGVTYIGDGAFKGCESLKEIEIPDGVTYIGDGAFNGCESLKEIKIPDGVTYNGYRGSKQKKEITTAEIAELDKESNLTTSDIDWGGKTLEKSEIDLDEETKEKDE